MKEKTRLVYDKDSGLYRTKDDKTSPLIQVQDVTIDSGFVFKILKHKLIKEGYKASDQVSRINAFYTNSEENKGVGTAYLEKVIEDAKERGSIALSVGPANVEENFRNFLLKKGFVQYNKNLKNALYMPL